MGIKGKLNALYFVWRPHYIAPYFALRPPYNAPFLGWRHMAHYNVEANKKAAQEKEYNWNSLAILKVIDYSNYCL